MKKLHVLAILSVSLIMLAPLVGAVFSDEIDSFAMYVKSIFPFLSVEIKNLNISGVFHANETHITNTTIINVNVTSNITVADTVTAKYFNGSAPALTDLTHSLLDAYQDGNIINDTSTLAVYMNAYSDTANLGSWLYFQKFPAAGGVMPDNYLKIGVNTNRGYFDVLQGDLQLESIAADVRVIARDGDIALETHVGDIELIALAGDVVMNSTGAIRPIEANAMDFGIAAYPYKDMYLSGDIYFPSTSGVASTILPNETESHDIGNATRRFREIHAVSFNGSWNSSVNYVPYTGATGNVGIGSWNLTADTITSNHSYIGNEEGDHYIYFYEDGSPTREYLMWNDTKDRFELSDELFALSRLVSQSDIYTTGFDDDLWLGSGIQANANFQAYADGSLIIADDRFNVSAAGDLTSDGSITLTGGNLSVETNFKMCLNGATCTKYIEYNGTNVIIQG